MTAAYAPEIPDLTRLDELGNDLLPMLNALREREAVVWNPHLHAWMLLRHADVLDAYQGRMPLSSQAINSTTLGAIPPEEQAARIPNIVRHTSKWVVNADGAYHQKARLVMMKGFTPRIIEANRPFVRGIVRQVLDSVADKTECDFVEDVMREVTVRTIMHLVGIPPEDLDDMKRWSDAVTDSFTRPFFTPETLERTDQAFAGMAELFRREIEVRRRAPKDDFLTHLVKAAESGDLTEDELISQLLLLLPAGHDSTTNTMVLALVALIRDRRIWDHVLATPDQLNKNIIELMRYVAMSSVSNRVAIEDFEVGGKQVKKGQFVLLMIASANRDPRVFADPEKFDPDRANDQQLVFGNGAHFCIGHLLAKMEISELLPAVMRRFPAIALRDEQLEFSTALAFRGLDHLWGYPHGAPAARS